MKNETLDTKIAKALTDTDVSVEQLDELITQAEQAKATAEQTAAAAEKRALNPAIADGDNSAVVAAENQHLARRYATAYEQLLKKRTAIEAQAYRTQWDADADKLTALRNEAEAEFNKSYKEITELWAYLVKRVQTVNQAVDNINARAPNGMCRVKSLDLAPNIIAGVKLPNPARTTEYLWPSPAPAVRIDMPMPYDRHYSSEWWQAKADDAARLKEAQRVAEKQREDAEAAAHPNQIRWWDGQVFPPGKAV